jgi:hypothetical protein
LKPAKVNFEADGSVRDSAKHNEGELATEAL